jgi:hypothetical protein
MSAFICSDKHFAVVAKALFASPTSAQQFADALKQENIKSVNYRYKDCGDTKRFRKVNLNAATADEVKQYDGSQILMLLNCIHYQSCEHPDYDSTRLDLAQRCLRVQGANEANVTGHLWAI